VADYRRPNKFLLTSRPASKGVDPLHKWRRFKTMGEAEAEAEAARNRSREKKKSPVREAYQKPVLKPYHSDQIAGTETVPLRMSETVPLSISRVGTPHLDRGNRAGLSRTGFPLTPSLPLTVVANAPQPDDALHSQSPTGRSAGPKLVWRAPVIRELAGAEAILCRNEINAADRNAQVADPMRLATIH
jgi:hypothetical protein